MIHSDEIETKTFMQYLYSNRIIILIIGIFFYLCYHCWSWCMPSSKYIFHIRKYSNMLEEVTTALKEKPFGYLNMNYYHMDHKADSYDSRVN